MGEVGGRKKKRKQKNQDRTCVNRTWLELEAGTNFVTISGWIGRTQMEMCGGGGGEGGKLYCQKSHRTRTYIYIYSSVYTYYFHLFQLDDFEQTCA